MLLAATFYQCLYFITLLSLYSFLCTPTNALMPLSHKYVYWYRCQTLQFKIKMYFTSLLISICLRWSVYLYMFTIISISVLDNCLSICTFLFISWYLFLLLCLSVGACSMLMLLCLFVLDSTYLGASCLSDCVHAYLSICCCFVHAFCTFLFLSLLLYLFCSCFYLSICTCLCCSVHLYLF